MTSTTFFIVFIPILAILLLAINLLLAPHNPYQEKDSAFECGFKSFLGQNRTEFSISFFIFGLLFLLFDLEILLVYPYSVSSYTNDVYGLVIMMVFFVLLTLGFIFELGKNALTIDSRQTSSYDKEELSTPHAYVGTINHGIDNISISTAASNMAMNYELLLEISKNPITYLILIILASIVYYSTNQNNDNKDKDTTWNWKVLSPFKFRPQPCQHPWILRKPMHGDRDFQTYKDVKCSAGVPVMPSLEQNRGTRCDICHSNFCANPGCSCKIPPASPGV
jgi:NADH-ubiquinone oxidoreductase chain 3